jgi:hypothetical protein
MTDRIHAKRAAYDRVHSDTRAFDHLDAKGRRMGYRVTIAREEWVADETCDKYGWLIHPDQLGVRFVVMPQGTRDGKDFGAIPVRAEKQAASLEEALKLAEQMFAKAEKAAAKKAAA